MYFFNVSIDFREREREREGNIDVRNIDRLPPVCTLTRDQTYKLGMCPEWKSILPPFGTQDSISSLSHTLHGLVEVV